MGHFAEGPDEVPVAIEQKTQVRSIKELRLACKV